MRNLIYQTYISKTQTTPKFALISKYAFEQYAEKHGAEYIFNDKLSFESNLKTASYYQRYQLFLDESFDEYDDILYVDSDVYPHNMDANIFDIETTGIACMPERDEPRKNWYPGIIHRKDKRDLIDKFWAHYGVVPEKFEDGQYRWYNTGVLLLSKEMRKKMREQFTPFEEAPENISKDINYDEAWFGVNITLTELPVTILDPTWNWTGKIKEGIVPDDAKFLHFSGGTLKKIMEIDYSHIINSRLT